MAKEYLGPDPSPDEIEAALREIAKASNLDYRHLDARDLEVVTVDDQEFDDVVARHRDEGWQRIDRLRAASVHQLEEEISARLYEFKFIKTSSADRSIMLARMREA